MIKNLIIILVFFSNFGFTQDTVYLKDNLALFTGTINETPIFESIEKYNYNFNGYLVIKIDKNNLFPTDSISYECTVYWIDSLKNIFNSKFNYYYFTFTNFIFKNNTSYKVYKDESGIQVRNFIKIFNAFNSANDLDLNIYLSESWKLLTTELFLNSIIWYKGNSYYIIFQTAFNTAIFNVKMPVWDILKEKYNFEDWKIFVPISKLKSFYQINEVDPEKFGLVKTKIIFKNLNN